MPVISRKQWETGETPKIVSPVALPEPSAPVESAFQEPEGRPTRPVPKPDDPWFTLQHPDATSAHQIECKFKMVIEGEDVEIELVRSRVDTQDKVVRDLLIARGYRWMNEEY